MGFLHRKFLGVRESEEASIRRNIQHLLSARRGAASFLRGFGTSETGFRTAEEAILVLGGEIREALELYEPRVEVTEIEDDTDSDTGRVVLKVHCRVRSTGQPLVMDLQRSLGRSQLE